MKTLVMKFGGSALGSSAALSQVLSIVLHESKKWSNVILVASALEGVTDMLFEAAHLAQMGSPRGYRRIAATLRARHLGLIEELPLGNLESTALEADVDRLLFEMLDICQQVASVPTENLSPEVGDRIAGVGERLSARIIAALLRQNGLRGVAIDGTDVIVTDAGFGNAKADIDLSEQRIKTHLVPMLSRNIVPVVAGYIGVTPDGRPTTMGRGGSDYTAATLSVCLDANELWMWSDVDGLMSADPDEVPDARVIDELSYAEVAELAYFGARILHARMIQPLEGKGIPLRIRNVYRPHEVGTLVRHTDNTIKVSRIKAITSIHGLALLASRSGTLHGIISKIQDELILALGTPADVMITAQSSGHSLVCFVIPPHVGLGSLESLRHSIQTCLQNSDVPEAWTTHVVSVATLIGVNLNQSSLTLAHILEQLGDLQLLGLAQGPSGCSVSLIIHPTTAHEALGLLHQLTLRHL